jgi:hypothetical protein
MVASNFMATPFIVAAFIASLWCVFILLGCSYYKVHIDGVDQVKICLQVQAVVPHLSFHRAGVYGILKNTNMKECYGHERQSFFKASISLGVMTSR